MIIQETALQLPFVKTISYLLSKPYSGTPDPYSPVPFNGGFRDYIESNSGRYQSLIAHLPQVINYFNSGNDFDAMAAIPCPIEYLSPEDRKPHEEGAALEFFEAYASELELPEIDNSVDAEYYDDSEERRKVYTTKSAMEAPATSPESLQYIIDPIHIHPLWYLRYLNNCRFAAEHYEGGAIRSAVNNEITNAPMYDEDGDIILQSDFYSSDEDEIIEDLSSYEDRLYILAQQLYRLGKNGPAKLRTKWRPLNMISFVACEIKRRENYQAKVLTNYFEARVKSKADGKFYPMGILENTECPRQLDSVKWVVSVIQDPLQAPPVYKVVDEFIQLLKEVNINLFDEDLSKYDPTYNSCFGCTYLPTNETYTSEVYAALTDLSLITEEQKELIELETQDVTVDTYINRFYNAYVYYETENNQGKTPASLVPITEILEDDTENVYAFLLMLADVAYTFYDEVFYMPSSLEYTDHILMDNGHPFLIPTKYFEFTQSVYNDCIVHDSGFIIPQIKDYTEVWKVEDIMEHLKFVKTLYNKRSVSCNKVELTWY